ncbi:MAG TPA: ATP-binding protein [Dongiaceae bacterium]|nr:ATP-binding protein [Dongiaceae bacterium]
MRLPQASVGGRLEGARLEGARFGGARFTDLRRWRTIFLVAILFVLGLAAILTLMLRSAEEQDAEARHLAEIQFGAALAATERNVATTTLDYAWWDDAYSHLAETHDQTWAEANLTGATVMGPDKLVQGALVFDAADQLSYGIWLGQSTGSGLADKIHGGLRQLLQEARNQDATKPHAVSGLLSVDGKPSIAAAAPLLPFSATEAMPGTESRHVLVFLKVLDDTNLQAIGTMLGTSQLRLAGPSRPGDGTAVPGAEAAQRGTAEVLLIALDGSALGRIQWQPPQPGRTIIGRLVPQIAMIIGIMTILAGIAIWLMLNIQHRNQIYLSLIDAKNQRIENNLRLWRITIEAIEYGVAVFDRRGQLLLRNQACQRIWGVPEELLRETTPLKAIVDWILGSGGYQLQPDESRPADLRPQETIAGGRWTYCRDERILEVQRLAVPEIGGFISISRDMTQSRRHEEELVQAWEQAVLANRAKSEFLANISHELRTPLNAIIGFSEVLELEIFGPLSNERHRSYVADIKASGAHLLSLINDILDLSKIEAGKFDLRIEAVDCGEILEAVARLIRPRADAGQLDFTVNRPQERLIIGADERALKQVLINLLSNAVKFTPAGGKVELDCHRVPHGIALVVRDTGIGISADNIATALAPFGQIDSHLSRRFEGTGLGLPIVKGICELHGGSLRLQSEVDQGTVVTATILDQFSRPGRHGGNKVEAASRERVPGGALQPN